MFNEAVIVSAKADGAIDEQEKFKMYYEYREPVAKIPSHRMLAIRRGEAANILYFNIELSAELPLGFLKSKVLRQAGEWTPHLDLAVQDSYKRLLNLSIQSEVRLELKQKADLGGDPRFFARIWKICCFRRRRGEIAVPRRRSRIYAQDARSRWWMKRANSSITA